MNDTPDGSAGSVRGAAGYGIAPGGYRMPAGMRLGPVRLQVADLERSLDYYQRVLGLRIIEREDGIARLVAEGGNAPLVELRERRGAAPVTGRGHLGLYHYAILLPTRADLGRFLRHLASIGEQAGASDHHVSEALYLRDPDGLAIEVYADRPRSEWQTSGRELRMRTDPLNVPNVVREAGDTVWKWMPAGTRMGHVHLHVGDLEQAAAFYHEALGLDKVVWSYPGALFLAAGGYHHHLGLNTWAAGAGPAGDADAKLLEWTIELPDPQAVTAAGESLEAAAYPAERSPDGEVVTRDPWGIQLRIRMARPQPGEG